MIAARSSFGDERAHGYAVPAVSTARLGWERGRPLGAIESVIEYAIDYVIECPADVVVDH